MRLKMLTLKSWCFPFYKISVVYPINPDTGSSLSTWEITIHAEFDEPVPIPSFTPLQDWITRYLLPSAAGNIAHFIVICHYWTRY